MTEWGREWEDHGLIEESLVVVNGPDISMTCSLFTFHQSKVWHKQNFLCGWMDKVVNNSLTTMYISSRWLGLKPGGYSEKFWRGCGAGFRNHILGYGDRGSKSYPWLRKMGQNQTLDDRKCHQINHFWSSFAWNWWNIAQILSFAWKKKWWN